MKGRKEGRKIGREKGRWGEGRRLAEEGGDEKKRGNREGQRGRRKKEWKQEKGMNNKGESNRLK